MRRRTGPRGAIARGAVALGVLFFLPAVASASHIAWIQRVTTDWSKGVLSVRAEAEAAGDEPAYEVFGEVFWHDTRLVGPAAPVVRPGETVVLLPPTTLSFPERPGWYPLVLRLRYHDGAGYPFSSVHLHEQRVGAETEPLPRSLALPAAEGVAAPVLRGTQRVVNLSGSPRACRAEWAAPLEFSPRRPAPGETVVLPPGPSEIPVEIAATAALPGSRYEMYLLVECPDAKGRADLGAGRWTVRVEVPGRPALERWGRGLVVLAAAGLSGYLVFLFARARRR